MTATKSTASKSRGKASAKPDKPYAGFPLFAHGNGRWAKKIRGKFHYFGKWDDWKAALELYQKQRDDLYAGRKPRSGGEGTTLRDLCNRFLTFKTRQLQIGEIHQRSFDDYNRATDQIIDAFGKNRLVDDLAPDDFAKLRQGLAKRLSPVSLGNEINRCRVVFNFGKKNRLHQQPHYGDAFDRPSKKTLRLERAKKGRKLFEREEIHKLLNAWEAADEDGAPASYQLRAMILLALNCGYGNNDCGTLPCSAVDLRRGWIDYHRPKTGINRRCPLWPETLDALREVVSDRKTPNDEAHSDLIFITKYGEPWAKITRDNPISKELSKLMKTVDRRAAKAATGHGRKPPAKIFRCGRNFYALRHTFRTIADEARDQPAVDHIMGHVRNDMASLYRERISDERLRAVTDYVRNWVFGNVAGA